MSDTSNWITVVEAAALLGVQRGQAQKLCKQGKLRAEQCLPRRGWLVDPVSIDEYREQVPAYKSLNLKEAVQAANLYLTGDYSMTELARLFGTTPTTISRAWERHEDQLPTRRLEAMKAWWLLTHGQAKLTPRKVKQARLLKAQGYTDKDIAKKLEVNHTRINRVRNEEAWSWVP